ncbi:HNH endonuclease signature motif containing protein [Phycicoccus avicenniae]|uniref:HNH endonuclease signature motif containing protein n=1 Tax=Phycicoccus avicenniae TaxID=2828860 RepID=UPI003D2ACD0B
MAGTSAAERMLAAARDARATVGEALDEVGTGGSVEGWTDVVGELQAVIDTATAAQDAAIVRLAAVEHEWAEDGTVTELLRPLGHVALDAPAVLSGVLNLTAVQAERRVRHAVRLAADGPEGASASTGLGGLHEAMAAGRLDAYRGQVVAHELEEVPSAVARAVVEALDPWLDREDAGALRRRCRRLLARISPDLLRQRAVRARSESGLRRWVDEPGVDTWLGTFPSEEACAAWAAIDALAQRYVADGTCERIDRARARALTDLVTSNATIDLRVTLTAPVDGVGEQAVVEGRPADLVPVHGPAAGEPVLVERGWLERAVALTSVGRDHLGRPVLACDLRTGGLLDPEDRLRTAAYRPGAELIRFVRARDGRCRFPGCHVAARFCDLDHVVSWPTGPTSAANLVCLCRRHHRIKQRAGWWVRLAPDGTATWTDPTGRTRTSGPRDHRDTTLRDTGTDRPAVPANLRGEPAGAPHSALEHRLEHHPPPARPWVLEYDPRLGHRRRCVIPPGDPPF